GDRPVGGVAEADEDGVIIGPTGVIFAGQADERLQCLDADAFERWGIEGARRIDGDDVAAVLAEHGDGDVEAEGGANSFEDELEEIDGAEAAFGDGALEGWCGG